MGPSHHLLFFGIHNSVIMTRINSLYGSQTSPVVVCMQNNEINIRITILYGSHPSSVVSACKTTSLAPELQVSMGPSPHLLFFGGIHNGVIMTGINSLYGSQTSPMALCMQNSVISTRNTSLHGSQTSPVVLCMQNNQNSIRNTSLYESQPSSVFIPCKTTTLGQELQVSMGPRHHLSFCAWKTA